MITDLPICGYFNRQRFPQFCPAETANWYLLEDQLGKKKVCMMPAMGRQHIRFGGINRLRFTDEPRLIDESINYWYSVVGDKIFRTDKLFNQIEITASVKLTTFTGDVFFTFIVVSTGGTSGEGGQSVPGKTFACFTDGQNFYLHQEETGDFGIVTDDNLPDFPWALGTFGNRIVVSTKNSSTYGLSEINLNYNASFATMLTNAFTIVGQAIFAQEEGIIRQMGVLQHTLYILCDTSTGIWSNIPSSFISKGGVVTTFPFKKNTTYSFDVGISEANAKTLDVDFGMMAWVGQNRSGINQPVITTGGKPQPLDSKAIDVLLQNESNIEGADPFHQVIGTGFLYDYENTVFYRFSYGEYVDTALLDQKRNANSLEYNFETKTWHKCIELNGERNRIQQHIFFGNRHLVTVQHDKTVYEMSGQFYTNEIENLNQEDHQAADAYLQIPFRYERITNTLVAGMIPELKSPGFYAEFKTDYVEIDFVWGDGTFIGGDMPFENAIYIVDEASTDENPIYVLSEDGKYVLDEQGNFPVANSPTYNNWFKPHIELYFSDDGGISFHPADVREFSQLGIFQWRMRWYQLGCSRNRVYKLICVSPAPIVVLGGSMEVSNVSGGAA